MSEKLSAFGRAGAEEVTDVMNATFARLLHEARVQRGVVEKEAQTPGAFGDLPASHGRTVFGTDGFLCRGRRGGKSGDDDKPGKASASHGCL